MWSDTYAGQCQQALMRATGLLWRAMQAMAGILHHRGAATLADRMYPLTVMHYPPISGGH